MLEAYDGGSDQMEHVAVFQVQMAMYGTSNAIMCRAFPTTLRRIAGGCRLRIPPRDEKGLLKTPNPINSQAEDWDRGRYYRFHHDYGHDTKECYDLKNQIEDLIRRGHLNRYIRKPREPSLRPKGPVERQVDVIIGGPAACGDSSSARKAYAHAEVQKRPRARGDPRITFESDNEYPDHSDALVITAHIANARVSLLGTR
ncbi:hypothetical protein BHM03_00056574 [Ensete ventricosum]|nr:hypothetical protein BHM03_00056574 [Ensete ventricosum]